MILTNEQIANFPVEHFSPSSIRKYLENPHGFFKNYVRFEYDQKQSPALKEGDCIHRVLRKFYESKNGDGTNIPKVFDWEAAADELIEELFSPDEVKKIDFGKTGSLDKSLTTIRTALGFYFADLPRIEHVVSVEERFLSDFEDLENNPMPIPLKGFTDLVTLEGDDYVIRDHKFVSFFVDPAEPAERAKYEMQSAPYFFLVRKRYGKNPTKMIFDEVKKSKNRDGGAQRRELVVEYEPKMLARWVEIYKRVVRQLAGLPLIDPETGVLQFIPNPFAQFGEEAWLDFCEEVDQGKVWTFSEIKTIRASRIARPEEVDALF